ncbi:VIT1/CCC1 transporter family protein [Sulfurisphaera javensis]
MDYNKNYLEELFDSEVYKKLADAEKDRLTRIYLYKLSDMEKKHSEVWKEIAEKRGLKLEKLKWYHKLKINFYVFFRKLFGLELTTKLLESGEESDIKKYYELSKSPELSEEEREKMRELSVDEAVHEEIISSVKSKDVSDFVYGISDGLVEVLAATSGLSGAFNVPFLVAISGLIIGASGTLSMAIGAYLSTKSEKEINENKRRKIEIQKLVDRKEVSKRLAGILTELGIKENIALDISPQLVDVAEDIIAPKVEESPKKSAGVTALSYITGAIVPVIPYLIGIGGLLGVISSYLVSGIAIFIVGSLIGLLSSVNPTKKGLEMLTLGISAAIGTHLLGLLASYYLHV